MSKLDILTEQCDICRQSATEQDCLTCAKRAEIIYLSFIESKEMNIEEFANMLDGREYGKEITNAEEILAKKLGYVVVFGYSDDNMELRGAIHDEFSCYEGGTAYVTAEGLLEECECSCKYYEKAKEKATELIAYWGEEVDGAIYSWHYGIIGVQCAGFKILEDGEPYCLGMVFRLEDLK